MTLNVAILAISSECNTQYIYNFLITHRNAFNTSQFSIVL